MLLVFVSIALSRADFVTPSCRSVDFIPSTFFYSLDDTLWRKSTSISDNSSAIIAQLSKKCPSLSNFQLSWRGMGQLLTTDIEDVLGGSMIRLYDCANNVMGAIVISSSDVLSNTFLYDSRFNLIGNVTGTWDSFNISTPSGFVLTSAQNIGGFNYVVTSFSRSNTASDPRIVSYLLAIMLYPYHSLDWCTNTLYYIIPVIAFLNLMMVLFFCCFCKKREKEIAVVDKTI